MENSDIIYGKNSITEALIAGTREINKIIISKNIHSDSKINKIKELAQERSVIFQFVAKEKFQPYAEFNHQGVIAFVSPIKYEDLDDFLSKSHENSSLVIFSFSNNVCATLSNISMFSISIFCAVVYALSINNLISFPTSSITFSPNICNS